MTTTSFGALDSESNEVLRERLLTLHREYVALQEKSGNTAQLLDALEGLLTVDGEVLPDTFRLLHKAYRFTTGLILAAMDPNDESVLTCIAAEPPSLIGTCWPMGPLFRRVIKGRALAVFSNIDVEEWKIAPALGLDPDAPALYMPISMRDRRAILVLVQRPGEPGFNRSHIELGQRFSGIVSHALAQRIAHQSAEERLRLRELSEQLKHSEQEAQRSANLLSEMVQMMPIGIMVQGADGKLRIANAAAARLYGGALQDSSGLVSMPGMDADASEQRMLRFKDQLRSGAERTGEHTITVNGEELTLLVTSKPVRIFDEDLMLTTSLDITARKRAEDELQRRTFHDQLTGLPNRVLIQEIVENALRTRRGSDRQFALAFIDLDNFKQVNDFYSHTMGDELLIAVARRITQALRPSDTLARISGDEFLMMIDPIASREELARLMERLATALKQPFALDGQEILTSASVGAAIYPLHGDNYEELRRCADNAMYRAKNQRKGSVAYFDASMGDALTARMELEQRLRVAIRRRHFRAAYQPKVSLKDGRVLSFEALVRWVEPDGKIIMPGVFIEMASELGLLDDITIFMLDDIAGDLPRLCERFGSQISVSQNLSALQVGDVEFMDYYTASVARHGVQRQLVVEMTEDALVAAHNFQHKVLPQLRELGLRVSIDDFGTGYSSLSVLSDITADEIKIDRAFITEIHKRPRSQGILRAVESLCNAFQIGMVAEGPETKEEIEYLCKNTSIGCGQGYFFSKPRFVEELETVQYAI